jgi:hypothetical protein
MASTASNDHEPGALQGESTPQQLQHADVNCKQATCSFLRVVTVAYSAERRLRMPRLHDSTYLSYTNMIDIADELHQDANSVENLSSIVAFNQGFQHDAPENGVGGDMNQWGKRPADDSPLVQTNDVNKRQHLDLEHTAGMSPDEQEVHDQLQAHMAASVYQHTQQQHLAHSQMPHHMHQSQPQQPQKQQQMQQIHQQQSQQQQEHSPQLPQPLQDQPQQQSQQSQQHDDSESALHYDEDEDVDPEFEVDEDDLDAEAREQDHMNSIINPAGHNWLFMDNSYSLWDANQNLRIHSLPILDNLVSFAWIIERKVIY